MYSPRWASWNLGVFMCIRCAGIHRNLGVHISRVKSVNLDQWTPEQIQSMVDMGNGRAKQLYEAHLPENFSRPQTDQSVEVFIRDKYERKKYYDKESVATALKSGEGAPHSNSPSFQADRSKQEKEHEKKRDEKKKEKDLEKADRHNVKSESRASPKKNQEAAVDLLGLDTPASQAKGSPINDELDIFGPMVSNPLPSSNNTQQAKRAPQASDPSTSSSSSSTSTCTTTRAVEKKLLSKDSILSLYASSSAGSQPQSQQQPATGQGIHMGPPHITQQGFNSAMMEGGAMTSGMTRANGSYVDMRQNTHGIQQGQWSVGQLSQQMSGMATNGGAPPSGTSAASWSAAPTASGQTLSTQLWK
ncbi:stromal membrane-associated protein 1-like isoform X2 [Hippocampus comes]|uniref:stromal membrane-associated protein 1-like isoform X2 n=1 Tax=Hippocampus comes TaxID=109280 RepID=UPI00094EC544|nr:PREDICTED: stromal membrane-associated protein 1-like isoform X2 [Hippocampus comes]